MNYVELKEFLRGLGLNTVTEYKNYAREKNAEKGEINIPVSPDLKFKKDGTWVSFDDLLEFSKVAVDAKVTKKEVIKPEVKEVVAEDIEVDAEVIEETSSETGVVGEFTTEWSYDELKIYISNMFTKLSEYKDFARKENSSGKLHNGKKLPVSPDIYFKGRTNDWVGSNDFLSIDSPNKKDLNVSNNKNLLKGLNDLENQVNDVKIEKAEKPMNNYQIKEPINGDNLNRTITQSLMRLQDHTFEEISLKDIKFDPKKVSGAYENLTKIKVAQTVKKSFTNVIYYDNVSATQRHTAANLLVSMSENVLSVLIFNSESPETPLTKKQIYDIINRIITSKSVLDETGKRLTIFKTLQYIEKHNIKTYLFFMENDYTVFISKDLDWKF